MPYVFPGVTQYANDAAKEAGLSDDQRGQVASGWHVKQVVGMLSSLPGIVDQINARRVGPEAARDVLDRIASVRAGIAAQLAAVDAAVADVVAGLGLAPEDKPVVKSTGKQKK